MPRLGERPAVFSKVQCTAQSKRSGGRCRNYACQGRSTCRMHGGKSKRGKEHWNYQNGLHSKDVKEAGAMIGRLLDRPLVVKVSLFPRPLEEIAAKVGRGQRLSGLIVPPERLTPDEWMRALRAAQRLLAQELAELRAEAADDS